MNWMQWCCVAYVALVVGAGLAFSVSAFLLWRQLNREIRSGAWGESWADEREESAR